MQDFKLSRWRPRLAWLVIFSLVAFIVYRNTRTSGVPDDNGITIDDIRIRVMGEELIGFKSVGAMVGPAQAATLKESEPRLIQQLDENVRTQNDRFHIAIIAGEVLGKDQVLSRLDALQAATQDKPQAELAKDIAAVRQIYADPSNTLDSAAQNRLIRRHDYFARVALSYGVPANLEPRKTIEAGGIRAMFVLVGLSVIFLVIIVGAVGFFIAGFIVKMRGGLLRAYVPDPGASTAYLEGFAIYFVLFILGFGLLRRLFGWESLQWEWLALLIIPVVMLWLTYCGASSEEQRKALGWHTGKGVFNEIGAGIAGYFAGIIVLIAGFFITYVLIKRTGLSPEHPLIHDLQGSRWHVLGLYLLVSVFAPVMEETMFRGALFHHLRRQWGWAVSAPIVAFIFAIIHPQGWVAVPVLGSIAIVLAALREWRGSLIAPMVAHGCNNFIVLTLALAVFR